MKIKTNKLSEDKLGFVVALLEYPEWKEQGYLESTHDLYFDDGEHYAPWKNWAQGGPIIERERIELRPFDGEKWIATDNLNEEFFGPTPLIAAMRCYVASRLGAEVNVPDELVKETA